MLGQLLIVFTSIVNSRMGTKGSWSVAVIPARRHAIVSANSPEKELKRKRKQIEIERERQAQLKKRKEIIKARMSNVQPRLEVAQEELEEVLKEGERQRVEDETVAFEETTRASKRQRQSSSGLHGEQNFGDDEGNEDVEAAVDEDTRSGGRDGT